jgi:hypothetical protein
MTFLTLFVYRLFFWLKMPLVGLLAAASTSPGKDHTFANFACRTKTFTK